MIGGVTAIVARLGVLNGNGVVLAAGCLRDGSGVLLATVAHDVWRQATVNGGRSVGFGRLHVEGDRVILTGRYDVHTPAGRFAWQVLRDLGDRARWSIGFHALRSRTGFRSDYPAEESGPITTPRSAAWCLCTVYDQIMPCEVSPVLQPAEPSTRTLSLETA